MSVSTAPTDATWLTTVPLANMLPRSLGIPAGLFYVGMSVTGDASGGGVTLSGELTFAKKQEHVYEWQGINSFTDSVLRSGDAVELTLNSGPRIHDPSGIFNNITFREQVVAVGNSFSGNTMAPLLLGSGTRSPFVGYGDKDLAGVYTPIIVRWQVNDLAVEYFVFGWGYYYRYQTFFRGLPPG